MPLQSQTGPQASGDQVQVPFRSGRMGDLIMSELHPRYYEQAYRRNIFSAANQTGIATTVGLATTYTGLMLYNPLGSGINMALMKVAAAFPVAVAAGTVVGLMVGYHASTAPSSVTAVTPRSNFVGVGAAPIGLAYTNATLPTTPTLQKVMGTIGTAAITAMSIEPAISEDFEGSIILPPGAYACIYTSAASGALGFLGSFKWEESPA